MVDQAGQQGEQPLSGPSGPYRLLLWAQSLSDEVLRPVPLKCLFSDLEFGFTPAVSEIGNLSASQLRRAAEIQEKIEELQARLRRLLAGAPLHQVTRAARPSKRRISAAGIPRIRAAQKARRTKRKVIEAQGPSNARPGTSRPK